LRDSAGIKPDFAALNDTPEHPARRDPTSQQQRAHAMDGSLMALCVRMLLCALQAGGLERLSGFGDEDRARDGGDRPGAGRKRRGVRQTRQ
jgi:hypothetical protein